jgi:hypothetical protein
MYIIANSGLIVTGVTTFNDNVNLGDNDTLYLGDDNDLQILHNGSYSLVGDFGVGNLILAGNTSIDLMNPGGTENYARFINSGAVELYYDNAKKFETTGFGVTVTGIASATSFSGDGSNLTGIVTSITAGSNISVDSSTGSVTITGLANTANIVSDTIDTGSLNVSKMYLLVAHYL